ncbi:retrovirus-related pol polyprotein from transposon TNT 1-94 [Tanacetum coccineum]
METKDTFSSCSNSDEQEMKQMQDKGKESCMLSFRLLHSHLNVLSNNNFNGTRTELGFKRAFLTLFDQDVQTFTSTMFLNVDQLENQVKNFKRLDPWLLLEDSNILFALLVAPRAWYDELLTFLMSKGLTKGLQIHQSPYGIFIDQAKYALEILKKHGMDKCDSINTPVATKPKLDADLSETPYSKDSGFELTAFSDADHAECLDTHKSTSRGIQFLGGKASQLDVQEARLHCNVNSRNRARGVIYSTAVEDLMLKAGKLVKEVLIMNLADHRLRRWTQNLSETKLRGRLLASKYQVKQGSSFQGSRPRFEGDSMDGASGLGRLPRWQLLGLVGGGKGLDWVEEGLGKRLGGIS